MYKIQDTFPRINGFGKFGIAQRRGKIGIARVLLGQSALNLRSSRSSSIACYRLLLSSQNEDSSTAQVSDLTFFLNWF